MVENKDNIMGKTITENKKAYYNYFISDETEAGIMLQGCEVKSIRDGHISIAESFIKIKNNEVFLKNAYIKPYEKTSMFIPDSHRDRKLLLNQNQISKLSKKIEIQGLTIVPLKVYFSDKNIVKILIGVGKGKKLYDKRNVLKEKTQKMEINRINKKLK